jgi:hypothetical protein
VGDDHQAMERRRATDQDVHVLACVECPRVSSVSARGWKAFRSDDPEVDEQPRLSFYCPACAEREFGTG